MSFNSLVNRNDYTGNGAANVYAYGYKIFAKTDLRVTVRNTLGAETTLTVDVDYTVSGVGSTAGGSITLVNSGQAWLTSGNLTTGYKLTVRRVRPLTQTADIRNQGDYYPETIEDSLDSIVMALQQIQDQDDRAIRTAETDYTTGLTIPSSRANQFLGFDSLGNAIAAQPSGVPVSSFMQNVVQAATAAAAQTLLGVSAFIQNLLDDASAAVARTTLGFGASGKFLTAGDITDASLTADLMADRGAAELSNLSLSTAVAANALTIALKTKAAADASASDKVTIGFRHGTATNGSFNRRTVAAPLSVVVSNGSTLGHVSGVNQFIYVYALDSAGTIELAVCNRLLDESALQTTTAEGGAGAADSDGVLYSTTARANVPIRLLGRLKSNQAAAGTWATAISETALAPLSVPHIRSEVFVTGGQGHGSSSTKIRRFLTTVKNNGTAITYNNSDATVGATFTINEDGLYSMHYSDYNSATQSGFGISLNSTQLTTSIFAITNADRIAKTMAPVTICTMASATRYLRAGDVIRAHTDAAGTYAPGDDVVGFSIVKVSA